ncbi:dipeptide ABC transporter ATP-binding protein [Desulfovibrio aminophilus]|uniref:ABC transporter ATP-binding protein n=1 Tax=Desulfovibrio aminophilus TaxID=81425 RepID=UPI003396AF02
MNDAPLMEARDLCRRYRVRGGLLDLSPATVHALDGVSLSLRQGETLGLVGESGCGKSTLARLLLALERPTSGQVLYRGRNVEEWPEKEFRRKVQMVFQDPYSSLDPRQKIGSAVGEALDIHDQGTPRERRERVAELLFLVGLSAEQANRYPHEFSGGQRQRAAIARALALSPELVICDEPVSALDVSIQAQVLNLLGDLQERLGLTYLFISHSLSVVGHVSDRVAVMYLGRLVELAPAETLFAAPLHPYTRTLLAAAPVPDPDVRTPSARARGELPSPLAPPPGCAFHPRCPEARDDCREQIPNLREVAPGRFVACHMAER